MMEETLLLPKLRRPGLRPDPVIRRRLWTALDEGVRREGRLALISAPPGFGKTTLAASWLQQWAFPAAWVSLDFQDNDPARFLFYLRAALSRLGGLEEVLPSLPAALNALEQSDGPRILVLDDYHWIVEPAVHEVVALLLEHQPAGLYCVMLTRQDPPLPLARLRARGQLVELRMADLQFTEGEAEEFLNRVMALGLPPTQIALWAARMEGWAAGLQLAALRWRQSQDKEFQVFSPRERFIDDYLVEEVLARQAPEVRRFLLDTAILDQFCGPLCDAVVEMPGSAERLIELERENLFLISLDRERRWYRYHALFGHWLAERLEPERLPLLHRRAAAWYGQQGLFEPAIGHALAAQDFVAAAGWIDQICWTLRVNGELRLLLEWLIDLPYEVIGRYPRLCIGFVECVMHAGKGVIAGRYLAAAEQGLGDDDIDLRCQVATFRAGAAAELGQTAEAARYLQQARALWRPENVYAGALIHYFEGGQMAGAGDPAGAAAAFETAEKFAHAAGHFYIAIVARCDRAAMRLAQRAVEEALSLYREALALATESGLGRKPVIGIACVHLGEALYAVHAVDEAEVWAEKGLALCQEGRLVNSQQQAEALLQKIEQARQGRVAAGSSLPEALTEREVEVLQLVAQGASNREIAATLFVTVGTVKTHLSRLMGKLGAKSRTAAVAQARKVHLI